MGQVAKILIVDDERRLCESLKSFLNLQGYDIETCYNGFDAMSLVSEQRFDIVLLDLFIQDIDGYQVLDHINRTSPDTPVIMMTGMATLDSALKALRKGVYDYLRKPFEHEALLKTVENALDHKRLFREHRRTAQALRESEEKYRSVFENTGTATIIIEGDTVISRANAQAETLTGYSKAEIEGHLKLGDLVTSKERQRLVDYHIYRSVGDPALSPSANEFTLVTKQKQLKTVFIQISPLPGTRRSIASITDISARKKTEEALKISEEKYRNILESIEEGYYETNLKGSFTFLNESMSRIFGIAKERLLGMNFRTYLDEANARKIYNIFHDVYKSFRPRRLTGELARKDSQRLTVEASVNLILDSGNSPIGFRGVVRDISEQKTVEKERKRLQLQLQQAQKMEAIGTLAGGIAHDFNNILSAIMGYSELAQADVPAGSMVANSLAKIHLAGERARDLVKQILTFSRQAEQELKPLPINPIVKEALKLLRASLPSTIHIDQQITSEAMVMADPTQIHQIMMNLCTNASHAMEEKGGTLTVDLVETNLSADQARRIPDLMSGRYLKLGVRDTGQGMSEAVRQRIFDPFFTTKEHGKGTGMGLSVVHGIVKTHRGAISVESRPAEGSTFSIYLPIIEGEKIEKVHPLTPIPRGSENILFVDDEDFQVEIGEGVLQRLGYSVTTRTSSTAALETFRSHPEKYDLVITDMTMPQLTGDVLARKLLDIRPDLPIIICTGYSERLTEEHALSIGIRELVMKPVLIRDLAVKIRRALDQPAIAPHPSKAESLPLHP